MLAELIKELQSKKDLKRARSLQRFFKTKEEKGKRKEFFLGIPVPELRRIAKKYLNLSLPKLNMRTRTMKMKKAESLIFI